MLLVADIGQPRYEWWHTIECHNRWNRPAKYLSRLLPAMTKAEQRNALGKGVYAHEFTGDLSWPIVSLTLLHKCAIDRLKKEESAA